MMKVTLTFKTPDVLRQAAEDLIENYPEEDDDDNPYLLQEAEEGLKEKLSKWVKYGECITVDFDLDANTATVREA